MRAKPIRFSLILLALALFSALAWPEAEAGSPAPNQPGPDEVILHGDAYFGAGMAYRFKIQPDMRQLTVYLKGHLLDKNFRSVQVGGDVIANLYRARPGRPDAGYDGKQLLHSETGLAPDYSILIVNRKADGRSSRGYRDLPFRVTVFAQWKTFISGGRLHFDEYFVSQSATHPTVHELSSVLLPSDQGADFFSLHVGRYVPQSIAVTFFDQPRAQGTNARTFPTPPAYVAGYSFWDYGFGDKARSLRITWKGPTFGSKKIPGVAVPSGPAPQFVVPDVKGFWLNPVGWRYEIGTKGKHFAWKLPVLKEKGHGVFVNGTDIIVEWTAADGSKHGPRKGKVERDANWRATKITLDNGLVLMPAGTPSKPSAPNLNGSWNSKYGKVVLQQQGANVKGTLHYPAGGTASLEGTIQGKTIQMKWFANPLAHGRGTLTISSTGKRLSGPFTDVVSKGSDTWVLTR